MDARASLIDAINDFEGAVVLVSHDTHLVKMVADQLWLVDRGTVQPFDGDIDEYQAKLLRERGGRAGREDKAARRNKEKPKAAPAAPAREQRKQEADGHVKRGPLKRALEAAEKDLAKLTQQRREIDARLADPATYSATPTVATELQKEKIRLERELAHAEHAWLVAQEALEAA
jgi:ATP-binding cassette subfamily F protein 3